jgi:hypothetical protein
MYLRLYADASKKLTMVARDDLTRAHTVTVNNACNEAGYYRIPAEDIEPYARAGHDPDALEKVLATVEGTTVPVIDKLIATNTAPSLDDLSTREGLEAPWDRYQLALFVALQMTRTWAFRRDLKELVDYSVQKRKEQFTTDDRIAKHLARLGKPIRPQDIETFRERSDTPDLSSTSATREASRPPSNSPSRTPSRKSLSAGGTLGSSTSRCFSRATPRWPPGWLALPGPRYRV